MSGLYGSLSIALSALITNQQALETSANNVANVNTPGFSRQRPVLVANDPVVLGRLSFGTGVTLQKFESLRDPILELRLNQETQNQGQLDATLGAPSRSRSHSAAPTPVLAMRSPNSSTPFSSFPPTHPVSRCAKASLQQPATWPPLSTSPRTIYRRPKQQS
jgi:hypothetical protein